MQDLGNREFNKESREGIFMLKVKGDVGDGIVVFLENKFFRMEQVRWFYERYFQKDKLK